MKKTLVVSLCLLLVTSIAMARSDDRGPANIRPITQATKSDNDIPELGLQPSTAQPSTTFLAYYTFDAGPNCTTEGWTKVDITAQTGDYWHVDDFAGLAGFTPLAGLQSLWCGARPDAGDLVLCGYAALPGYGNNWNQAFRTKDCLTLSTNTNVNVMVQWDSEPDYDATDLEVDHGCVDNWVSIYGGLGVWDGAGTGTLSIPLADPHSGTAKFRFRFTSDTAWSDEDGLWDTSTGAFILDNLSVTDDGGTVLAVEDFEGESPGDNDANDWESSTPAGYGDFAGLYHALTVVQEDPCAINLTCVWAFFNGSTYNYGCGGFPAQSVVPYENMRGQYINSEVWSPEIAVAGTGTVWEFGFDVYRDMPLSTLIFYVWHVRTIVAGCPGGWDDLNFVYYGGQKDWFRLVHGVGQFMDGAASHVQLAIGVVDFCLYWSMYGCATCHSHAPLFDNVELYRVAADGPQWGASRDLDQFQDNFSEDGTITGTARADEANDILPSSSVGILPGDSACVTVEDPDAGIDYHTTGVPASGPAVYCYVSIDGPNSATPGADLIEPSAIPGRRHSVTGNTLSAGGRNWIEIQMDSSWTSGGGLVPDRFNIDLNDVLFVPGDTIWYFYGARSAPPSGVTTYGSAADGWSGTASADEAANSADEFTILPASGGDFLYVDGMNFRGAQPYFDTAFQMLGIDEVVDRYDIRGPSSAVANHLGARVKNVFAQLIGIYQTIIWNTGDLTTAFGDGSGTPDKSPDCQLLFDFLEFNPASTSGVYLSGDDVAFVWQTQFIDPSATALKTRFINFVVATGNHTPMAGVSPMGVGSPPGTPPGGVFWKSPVVLGPDSLIIFGGCPQLNDFDVIAPVAPALVEMDYHGNGVYPAVVGQTTVNTGGNFARFILSGFSYHYIRDHKTTAIPDRVIHMLRILQCFNRLPDIIPGDDTPSLAVNELGQNYPNPFNPTTTIHYSLAERGQVSLRVYNVAGQLVKTLVDQVQSPGAIEPVRWDGRNDAGQPVSSGVYFYKLIAKNYTQTKKMVLLK